MEVLFISNLISIMIPGSKVVVGNLLSILGNLLNYCDQYRLNHVKFGDDIQLSHSKQSLEAF